LENRTPTNCLQDSRTTIMLIGRERKRRESNPQAFRQLFSRQAPSPIGFALPCVIILADRAVICQRPFEALSGVEPETIVLQTMFASPVIVPKWVESDSNRQSRCLRGRGFTIILPTLTLSEQESNLRGTCLTGKRGCQQSPSEITRRCGEVEPRISD
jgi:hypothetical protein